MSNLVELEDIKVGITSSLHVIGLKLQYDDTAQSFLLPIKKLPSLITQLLACLVDPRFSPKRPSTYGNQSTDLDMAGRAHSEHHAPLRGLEPDTIYHYRLQGTGSDGTFFASEDLTFRTPSAEEDDDDLGSNLATLAAGAQVIASSTFGSSATWGPENAIDDDPRTEWSSATDGNAAFIEIELASTTAIRAVGLWTRTMGSTAQIIEFRVVTEDGVVLGPFTLPDANQLLQCGHPFGSRCDPIHRECRRDLHGVAEV